MRFLTLLVLWISGNAFAKGPDFSPIYANIGLAGLVIPILGIAASLMVVYAFIWAVNRVIYMIGYRMDLQADYEYEYSLTSENSRAEEYAVY